MAAAAAAPVIGSAISKMFGKSDQQQLEQQQKLQDQQIQGAKELAGTSLQNQKDMWDYTNYENQKSHMEAAGLNPALMYGQGGGGGVTAGSGAVPTPTGATASDAASRENANTNQINNGIQLAMMSAQKAVMESQTEKNQADANLSNTTANKMEGADTENVVSKTTGQNLQNDYQSILNQIQKATANTQISTKFNETDISKNQADLTGQQAINEEKKGELINNQISNTIADTILKQTNTNLSQEQATKIANEIQQKWKEINIQGANTSAQHADRQQMMKTILISAGIQNADKIITLLGL